MTEPTTATGTGPTPEERRAFKEAELHAVKRIMAAEDMDLAYEAGKEDGIAEARLAADLAAAAWRQTALEERKARQQAEAQVAAQIKELASIIDNLDAKAKTAIVAEYLSSALVRLLEVRSRLRSEGGADGPLLPVLAATRAQK